jgi:cyclopropane fatty-acyl-phospholipid synthase-like methyltransferase
MGIIKTDWNKYPFKDSFITRLFLKSVWNGYKSLLNYSNLKHDIKIMELGSGTGYNSYNLTKEFKVSKVTLVDSNKGALASSKKRFKEHKVELINDDVMKLKIKGKYDLVHSQGLIEHFQGNNLVKIIRVHADYVKKGGYLLLFYPTPTITYNAIRKVAELLKLWIFSDEIPLKSENVKNLVEKHGFRLVSSTRILKYTITEDGLLFKKIT